MLRGSKILYVHLQSKAYRLQFIRQNRLVRRRISCRSYCLLAVLAVYPSRNMGGRSSKTYLDDSDEDKGYAKYQAQREMQKKVAIPLQTMVAHYTPASFPLLPVVDANGTDLCRKSWHKIVSKEVKDPYGGPSMSGMTAFYNEFYDR